MIRRAAQRIADAANGYVIAGLVKKDLSGNETYALVFEDAGGVLTELLSPNVKFTDGSPAEIETFD